MKKIKPPILTPKDLSNIRTLLLTDCSPLNRETRKRIRKLEKEVKKLREQKKIDDALLTDGANVIAELRKELQESRALAQELVTTIANKDVEIGQMKTNY